MLGAGRGEDEGVGGAVDPGRGSCRGWGRSDSRGLMLLMAYCFIVFFQRNDAGWCGAGMRKGPPVRSSAPPLLRPTKACRGVQSWHLSATQKLAGSSPRCTQLALERELPSVQAEVVHRLGPKNPVLQKSARFQKIELVGARKASSSPSHERASRTRGAHLGLPHGFAAWAGGPWVPMKQACSKARSRPLNLRDVISAMHGNRW